MAQLFINIKNSICACYCKQIKTSLSDWNWPRTHNHLVYKRTINHLAKGAKWLSCVVSTYLYGAFDCILLSFHVRVWPNGQMAKWLRVLLRTKYSKIESSCSHLNFRFDACFEQGVPWYSGNDKEWIHSETRTWHDKNMQSNAPYR